MPNESLKLLLIEDEQADAELFRELISEISGEIEVTHARHGQEALEQLLGLDGRRRIQPDLIVLDLNMPVMNGHEFLREAKSHRTLRAIPVLVLTTSERPADINSSYQQQASGYVVKPGNYDEYHVLLRTIESYWSGAVRLPTLEQLD